MEAEKDDRHWGHCETGQRNSSLLAAPAATVDEVCETIFKPDGDITSSSVIDTMVHWDFITKL